MPVELAELPAERLPEAVELAAYFVVAEGLTNVAKYANATPRDRGGRRARTAASSWRWPTTESAARIPEIGTGLRGLADRIAVLEGRLEIDSERGRGTTLRAQIPCA